MTYRGLLAQTVTIVTPSSTVDRYGNTVDVWAGAVETEVAGWIHQAATSEIITTGGGPREGQVSEWTLFLLPGVTISAADRVEWDGITLEVAGRPRKSRTPRGVHHVEVPLRAVEG